jgi:hypothetical protein
MSCLSKMELDVKDNPRRQVSQFVNHDNCGNVKKYKQIIWVLHNTNVLVIIAMGPKF